MIYPLQVSRANGLAVRQAPIERGLILGGNDSQDIRVILNYGLAF